MAQLTVRNAPEETVRALRTRAAIDGRSAEAEHRLILADGLKLPGEDDFWKRADTLRGRTKRRQTDSGVLQRQMHDER